MGSTLWFIIIGILLIATVVTRTFTQKLAFSTAMFYLGAGFALGPVGVNLMVVDAFENSWLIERLTEVAVIISLFSAGLKLSPSLQDRQWWIALRLAFGSMLITVALIALAAFWLLGFSAGAAILLGALLAPTDPVLASDVQVNHYQDRDRLRFSLTGEAGLNDGAAFPFVMLGLGLLGLHELGTFGWRWLAVDVIWACAAGLAIGGALGYLIGELVIYLRAHHKEAVGLDEFLALGLISLSYGLALLLHAYGFLAVFAAGLALRRIERNSAEHAPDDVRALAATKRDDEIATRPDTAPAYMANAVLAFNERAEHIGEFIVLLFIGAILAPYLLPWSSLWFVALLFFVIRPLAVWIGLAGSDTSWSQRNLIAWFGIRGLGTIYYLSYALQHGITFDDAEPIVSIVLTVVAISIVLHGISVPPLMNWYRKLQYREQRKYMQK